MACHDEEVQPGKLSLCLETFSHLYAQTKAICFHFPRPLAAVECFSSTLKQRSICISLLIPTVLFFCSLFRIDSLTNLFATCARHRSDIQAPTLFRWLSHTYYDYYHITGHSRRSPRKIPVQPKVHYYAKYELGIVYSSCSSFVGFIHSYIPSNVNRKDHVFVINVLGQ